jgi:hypothetical protein
MQLEDLRATVPAVTGCPDDGRDRRRRPGRRLADRGSTALTMHQVAERLQCALEGRDIIGQAKGVRMARDGLNANDAFEVLRRRSQHTNARLRDVAQQLVAARMVRSR